MEGTILQKSEGIADLASLCSAVSKVARNAGLFIKSQLNTFQNEDIQVKDLNSLVTYVDIESEKQIVHQLRQLLPSAGFITEEQTTTSKGENPDLFWVIDPLDGTTNFLHQIPFFCVSIALREKDDYLIGVVYDVMHDELYHAYAGGGAFINDDRLTVSTESTLSASVLATGFPYNTFDFLEAYLSIFRILFKGTRGIRRIGSAALDMCYVARGRFAGFYECGLNEYDVAAGVCIVREAGGQVSNFIGSAHAIGQTVLATNGQVHSAILEIIQTDFIPLLSDETKSRLSIN